MDFFKTPLPPGMVAVEWFVVCSLVHMIGAQVLTPANYAVLKRFEKPQRDLRDLPNTVVATIHAATMFVGAVLYMLPRLDTAKAGYLLFPLEASDIHPNHRTEVFWVEAMLGYIVYDTIAGLITGSNGVDIVLHHLAGGLSWGSILYTGCGGVFAMWIHLAEGSTPFLHIATTLFKLRLGDTLLFKLVSLVLLTLFTVLRVGVTPLCAVALWRTRAGWGADNQGIFWFNLVITVFFILLNFSWWLKLMQRAVGGGGGKKKGGKGGAAGAADKKAGAPAAEAKTD